MRLRADPRSLAATKGISIDFFSSGYLDVSVPRVRLYTLCIQVQIITKGDWVSPFGNLRVKASLSAHRSLSQTTTSFIASYCLGIHRMRLVTWPYNPKKSNYSHSASITWLQNFLRHTDAPDK